VYHAPKLSPYFWAFSGMMTLGALNMFLGRVLAGYCDVARRTLITHFMGTPATILIAVLLISLGFGLVGYLAAQVLSALLVLALLAAAVWKLTPAQARFPGRASSLSEEVRAFSVVACAMAGLHFLLAHTDKIVLGYCLDPRQVGVYAVAMALVGFVNIGLDSVNQIFSPMISELYAAKNLPVLRKLYATLTRWITIVSLPLALTMIVFARPLMSIFGPGFESGAVVLTIAAAAQIVNCGVGSVGYLLLMSGNQNELIKIQAVNAALMVVLNAALVPRLGIAGAAIAATVTTITTNVWALDSVRRILRITPQYADFLRLLLPAICATGGVLALARFSPAIHRPWEIAALGLFAAYTIFGGTLLLTGLDSDDRLLAGWAWQRVRRTAIA
jgi:O-antigen/teichoic acid export membrane protein